MSEMATKILEESLGKVDQKLAEFAEQEDKIKKQIKKAHRKGVYFIGMDQRKKPVCLTERDLDTHRHHPHAAGHSGVPRSPELDRVDRSLPGMHCHAYLLLRYPQSR